MYLTQMPLVGAFAVRARDGREWIVINYDQLRSSFGQDFTDCLDLEIEHEVQELLLTRGQKEIDPFGSAHYEAIRCTLQKAHKEGLLDRYLELKTATFETISALGDVHAMRELDYYTKTAAEIRTPKLI